VKFFSSTDLVEDQLVNTGVVSGNFGNLIRSFVPLVHQFLLHLDPNFYTPELIEEAYCSQPELIQKVCTLFHAKFHPEKRSLDTYEEVRKKLVDEVTKLDTGNEKYDALKRNVLLQTIHLIQFMLKTNFFRRNLTALSFRIDPRFMEELPYDKMKIFPEIPFGIFYMVGMNFFGFHVRFKDLARGGLRTLNIQNKEQSKTERNHVFQECYNLAYTQHKKNKEIPEGGSKGLIFVKPFDRLDPELAILRLDLEMIKSHPDVIETKLESYRQEQRIEQIHSAQRSYIESLITLVNCEPDGTLRAKQIADYYLKPEYIYIGPDENMSNPIIEWIANYSKKYDYLPGSAFITSKPKYGINHKQYGVTSLGVVTYMESMLKFIGIDPAKESFTLKLSGGPDGDVAGNLILNLFKKFPNTAKIVALTDVSGTIQDQEGLDLSVMAELFHSAKPIRHYPYEKLHEGAFLVDIQSKKSVSAYVQKILCARKIEGKVVEDWLSASEANHILRMNMHSAPADVFVSAGGRPRTLNESNWQDFLDPTGKPTAKVIIEGANLYLSNHARLLLEDKGVLIVKDSSANKCGVICSSYEVLAGLTLTDELFLDHKETLVEQILEKLKQAAENEADLLIDTYAETNIPMTEISNEISDRMNRYKYEILESLLNFPLPKDENHPFNQIYFNYCLPLLSDNYRKQLLHAVPEKHRKAVISAFIASKTLYCKGLSWSPSIVDILPIILQEITHN
jgi:glutamate dehydrogenase